MIDASKLKYGIRCGKDSETIASIEKSLRHVVSNEIKCKCGMDSYILHFVCCMADYTVIDGVLVIGNNGKDSNLHGYVFAMPVSLFNNHFSKKIGEKSKS